jgi:hypothetical protein
MLYESRNTGFSTRKSTFDTTKWETMDVSDIVCRGVGFLLSPKGYKSLNTIESINPRILIASFHGNPLTNVICCYSPTNSTDEEEVEFFYSNLTDLGNSIPKHNLIIIGGDSMQRLEKLNRSFHHSDNRSFHQDTNRNGRYLLDLLAECIWINLSFQYQKKSGKRSSFTYPNGQLDLHLHEQKVEK